MNVPAIFRSPRMSCLFVTPMLSFMFTIICRRNSELDLHFRLMRHVSFKAEVKDVNITRVDGQIKSTYQKVTLNLVGGLPFMETLLSNHCSGNCCMCLLPEQAMLKFAGTRMSMPRWAIRSYGGRKTKRAKPKQKRNDAVISMSQSSHPCTNSIFWYANASIVTVCWI